MFAQDGACFMDMLTDTVRDEIADCSEKSYNSVPVADLQKLLMIHSEGEFVEYVNSRGWIVEGGFVKFNVDRDNKLVLDAQQLISDSLIYAKELERIV